MLRSALLFVTAILLALTAGRAFWVWLGESPFGMAGATYVEFFQRLDQRIAIPMAIIGILGPVLAGICAMISRANRHMFLSLVTACGFGVVGVLVTVIVNVPINEQIAGWNPAALPQGYDTATRPRRMCVISLCTRAALDRAARGRSNTRQYRHKRCVNKPNRLC